LTEVKNFGCGSAPPSVEVDIRKTVHRTEQVAKTNFIDIVTLDKKRQSRSPQSLGKRKVGQRYETDPSANRVD
jgi:hypothetical protein